MKDYYESVKINKTTVQKVRDFKKKTGTPINKFFELLAEAYFKKHKK